MGWLVVRLPLLWFWFPSMDVTEVLSKLLIRRGLPCSINNGPTSGAPVRIEKTRTVALLLETL